jgi:hypothetical protein
MGPPRAFRSFGCLAGGLVALWLFFAGACLTFALLDPEPDPRHAAITISARYTVGLWFGTCLVMLWVSPREWSPLSPRLRLMRLCWTLAVAMLVVHVVFAFWLAHGWSHDAGVRHVAATGGFGWGIVVNYLFAGVWLADAAWWWANPDGYATRPRRVGYAVHGFLAFVVFNATVVFGPPGWRIADGALFGVLAALCWRTRSTVAPT